MIERRVSSWFAPGKYSPTYRWVSFDKIAPAMGAAVIASEDQEFPATLRIRFAGDPAGARSQRTQCEDPGASTLTQQTAKNLFLWPRRSWFRKGAEAYFTVFLEVCWDKRRILETYLNIVEFGEGIYGVEAAAQHYFGKPASRLSCEEAASLAAVLPNPRRYKVNSPGPVRARTATMDPSTDESARRLQPGHEIRLEPLSRRLPSALTMLPATTHSAPTMLSALNASGVTHAKAARAPIIEPATVNSGADAATEPTRETSQTSRAIPNAPYATTVFTIPNINARNAPPMQMEEQAGFRRWRREPASLRHRRETESVRSQGDEEAVSVRRRK